jgi:meso-butanediol dehydrogenase / (S,S)-butanediol dehydrogenase / diacetyl reductase
VNSPDTIIDSYGKIGIRNPIPPITGDCMSLIGKVAIITGGGTGIGAATARRFVAEGAKVCITGRRASILEQVVQSLPAGMAVQCPGDVSAPGHIEQIVETALGFGAGIDVLVNNAAMGTEGSVTSADIAEWRRTLEVNVISPLLLMRAVIPHMVQKGGGSIINVSSLSSLRSIPNASAYCTSKAALNALSQQAALDYGQNNIRCNVICPGFVFTEMAEKGPLARVAGADMIGFMNDVFQDIPSRKPAVPDDVAGICAFLASDDSTYVTGVVIRVDGGVALMDPVPASIKRVLLERGRKS